MLLGGGHHGRGRGEVRSLEVGCGKVGDARADACGELKDRLIDLDGVVVSFGLVDGCDPKSSWESERLETPDGMNRTYLSKARCASLSASTRASRSLYSAIPILEKVNCGAQIRLALRKLSDFFGRYRAQSLPGGLYTGVEAFCKLTGRCANVDIGEAGLNVFPAVHGGEMKDKVRDDGSCQALPFGPNSFGPILN